ncbi:MAG: Cell division protein ftsZ [Parcubacteria group bacterium GW2011_GWA2_49_9]|nr:MAG: Cell division protein ftsZ [Parcubacteria group bacterium GW2011_GWA2_49_9]
MPQITPDVEAFARIKVFGCGGSGKNALNHMINSKVKGVEFIGVNTDAQDLHNTQSKKKIHIGKNLTRGLGTGMNPEIGKRAAEETREELQEAIKGADMVFIAGGEGGGTFTGSAPIVAKTAKEMGALTVAVTTKPFFFEGTQRLRLAEQGLEELRKVVDAIIVIPNDRLLAAVSKETTAKASATGEKRAEEAAKQAINSPLLELSINGAKGVLFSIAGGDDLTMFEIQDAAKVITESIDPNAKVIFGTIKDEKLKKGEVKITVIASGFPDGARSKPLFTPEKSVAATEDKGKIFNTIMPSGKETPKPPVAVEEKKVLEDVDDDWGAVPAFLRRAKK